jgi:hypothetical protein
MAYNNNDSILVRNVGGTSAPRYRIADLHAKFQRAGGTSSTRCQVKGCSNPGQATAHVRLVDLRRTQEWMLCWVCNHHNNPYFTDPHPLRKNAFLVPVRQITGN